MRLSSYDLYFTVVMASDARKWVATKWWWGFGKHIFPHRCAYWARVSIYSITHLYSESIETFRVVRRVRRQLWPPLVRHHICSCKNSSGDMSLNDSADTPQSHHSSSHSVLSRKQPAFCLTWMGWLMDPIWSHWMSSTACESWSLPRKTCPSITGMSTHFNKCIVRIYWTVWGQPSAFPDQSASKRMKMTSTVWEPREILWDLYPHYYFGPYVSFMMVRCCIGSSR